MSAYGLFLCQLMVATTQLVSLKACLVIHFVWTKWEATSMNLWLSPHGIWYFRKVTIMPCGRRKEIKKTLHTRDKSEAKKKVLELLACVRSGGKTHAADPLPSSFLEQANLRASDPIVVPRQPEYQKSTQRKQPRPVETPKLSKLADKYLKEGGLSWAAQATRHQKHYIYSFIEQTGTTRAMPNGLCRCTA